MFVLRKKNENKWFYLSEFNKEYTIGRKGCDIPITDDQSISRKHAIVKNKDGAVKLEDCGSKYKTYCNGKEVKKELGEVTLQNGDEIQFGVLKSKFLFQIVNVYTTGSRLISEQTQKLKKLVKLLNGTVSDTWDNQCTHLTVQEIMLSIKVLHALIDEKPIVTLAFWEKYVECMKKNLPPPSVDKYKPPMAEALLNSVSFAPDPRRKTLFQGKVFIFITEKGKVKMEEIITKTGGACISWQKDPLTVDDVRRSANEYLVIQAPGEDIPSSMQDLLNYFEKQNKRIIPIQEIAMAIVLCSCEKDCNPSFNRVKQVFKHERTEDTEEKFHLAKETQSEYFSSSERLDTRPSMIIPESVEPDISFIPSKNENIDVSVLSENPFKRQQELNHSKDEIMVPPKRMKQEEDKCETVRENNTDKTLIPEDVPTQRIEKVTPSSSKVISTPKRKAEEDSVTGNKKGKLVNPFAAMPSRSDKKQTDTSINPFMSLQKKVTNAVSKASIDNPFKKLPDTQRSKENQCIVITDDEPDVPSIQTKPLAENPFKSIIQKRKLESPGVTTKTPRSVKEVFSSTRVNDQTNDTLGGLDVSRIGNTTVSFVFLSKDKIQKDKNHNIKRELDPELESFCSGFKDSVIIKEMVNYIRKESLSYEINDSLDGTSDRVKNFKKFKKVQPLRPQNTIIASSNLKRSGGEEAKRTILIVNDSDDDVQEMNGKTRKRFNF